MPVGIPRLALLAGLALALLAAACGAAKARDAGCAERCDVAYMSCIEQGGCVDTLTGQLIPCEEECGAAKAACAAGCGG